jgi:SAM-dependent methyltransferase
MAAQLDHAYWDQRYLDGDTGWDTGGPSPALITYFGQIADRSIPILIPGCGNGYEVGWLLENGFTDITVIDVSPVLTARLRPAPHLTILTGDFFELKGQYGLIVEQTFFCALDPSLRAAYIAKMQDLLVPGGKLMGLLFDRDFTGGPPFGGHREEYTALLAGPFTIRRLEPCYNSIKPRAGSELFFIAELPFFLTQTYI